MTSVLAQLIAPLLALPDVNPALAAARTSVDTALRHKALRRSGGPLAAEIGLRSAVASAALEGHAFDVAEVRVMLATVAIADAAASDLCDDLLREDERFALP